MPDKTHMVALLVSNEPGVLARISSMFMKRHFNIDTLTVSSTTNPDVSRITLSFTGDDSTLEQVTKQLVNFIDVRKVFALDPMDSVASDLGLLKVRTDSESDKNKIHSS
jgi:acetolactate synthase I/III small subunit